jgi:mono/diheme cytochrome c family protein
MPSISPENLPLLKSVLLLTLLAHFSLLGVLLGSASAAVVLDAFGRLDRRRHWRALAVELVVRTMPGRGTALLLTLTGALLLLGVQLGYPPLAPTGVFWALTLVPLFVGLLALTAYRRLLPREESALTLVSGLGAAGILLGLLSCFLLCCGAGLLVMPEEWPMVGAMPLLFLSWSGTACFLQFTVLSLAATGAVVLLLGDSAAGGDSEAPQFRLARQIGATMALVFLLAWPPLMLFGLINLPEIALGTGVYGLAAAGVGAAAVAAIRLAEMLRRGEVRGGRFLLGLILVLFAIWVLGNHLEREAAISELTLAGLEGIGKSTAPGLEEEKEPAGESEGRAVFERICTTCHRFDEKLVGPPLKAVLPPYREDIEALKAFIRQPVKKNPEYPAMPQLGLKESEIDAVARYLLARLDAAEK